MTPKARCSTQSLQIGTVDWPTYSRLLRAFAEQPGVRLAYDRGELEFDGPSAEISSALFLGRLVWTLSEELGLPIRGGGSTTLRRRDRRCGIDPSKSFWIGNASPFVDRRRLDFRTDPPPDLAIEVEAISSSLDRRRIYAALGVPELWWMGGGVLTFFVLDHCGLYAARPHSKAFPLVTPGELLGFLNQVWQCGDENAEMPLVRDCIRRWHGR
jgi:Uma2 family endonuclease